MNYLQLCQFAQRYIAGGNNLPGTAPTTVVGQEGLLYEIVLAVADAYKDVQNDQDYWSWMTQQAGLTVASGVSTLTEAQIIAQLPTYARLAPFTISNGYRYVNVYTTSIGIGDMSPCQYIPYQPWRGLYDMGVKSTGKPVYFTIRPNGTLEFNCITGDAYTIATDYITTPVIWVQTDGGTPGSADAQTPSFNTRFHEIVAWRAVMYWSGVVESGGKYKFAENNYERFLGQMRENETPEMLFSLDQYYASQYPGVF